MRFAILLLSIISSSLCCYSSNNEEPDYLGLLDKCLYVEYATVKMEMYKKGEVIRYYDIESYRQGEKLRMEFGNPATERGRIMLSYDSNLWMYLPRTSKVLKLPFKQSFMGSDASNRDLMRMAFKKDYLITKNIKSGNDIIVLELKAKDSSISYNKMVITLDKNRMVPLKQEMYSLSGKLIKTMNYENIILVDGVYIASVFSIVDEIQRDTMTKLTYSKMRRKNSKPVEFFTLASIKK